MEKGARREERVAERDRVFVFVVVVRNGLAFRENEVLRCGEDEGRGRDESATEWRRDRERSKNLGESKFSRTRGLSKERDKVREREDERSRGRERWQKRPLVYLPRSSLSCSSLPKSTASTA